MWSGLVLIIVLLHAGAIGGAAFAQNEALFNFAFTDLSPVVLFFSMLESVGIDYQGKLTNHLVLSIIVNVVKYFSFVQAFAHDQRNFANMTAVLLEGLYLAAVTASLFYYAEL